MAIAGLGLLGYHAIQLHIKVAEVNGQLVAQTARYDHEIKLPRTTLEKAKLDAQNLISTAQQQAAAQLASANDAVAVVASEAKAKASTLKSEAQAALDAATVQAAKILDGANKKAEEIAGSAFDAMKNAALYEQTAKAMKNRIEGYGDEYIIPQQSLLDDLADDFSHAQAGQELKRAREAIKAMIRNGTAAACEYVEANRRETAITFVTDAFNGRVDSILSRVKHDNAGKLEQQIRDAFALVNYNGKAFREARISEAYLASRLDELKWTAIVQQLALNEREEQRRIKEQAREKARVQKEYDRAMRQADKEEAALLKGIEEGKRQAERASGEQKAMYEERLREMAEELKQVQELKQRTQSRAQQTKQGYVYIISNVGSFGEDVYKIGLTRRLDPRERVDELGDSSVPFDFDVHALILADDAPKLEQQLHTHFRLKQMNKVNHRKEFFRVSLQEIREEIEELNMTTGVHWTMTGEAQQFRESQVIEQRIKDNPAEREKWLNRQLRLEQLATASADAARREDDEQ